MILSAVYMLWMFQRVNYGELRNPHNRSLPDLSTREWAMVIPIVAMAIFMGVLPNVFLHPMEASVNRVIQRITDRQPAQVRTAPAATAPPMLREGRATGSACGRPAPKEKIERRAKPERAAGRAAPSKRRPGS